MSYSVYLVQNCTVREVAHCFVSSLELLLHYVKITLQGRNSLHEQSSMCSHTTVTSMVVNYHNVTQFNLTATATDT